MSGTVEPEAEARAWGWVAHLRAGGTTPWLGWRDPAPDSVRAGRFLPGAQQLELLRRVNLLGAPGPVLVERILTTSAPGRGQPDLGLVAVLPDSGFGPPPVDPAALPPDELVRVATALVAEDVVRAGDPPEPRKPRRFRRHYRLIGDPELARPVREALVADGYPPTGRAPTVVVLGTALDRMLVDLWTARCLGPGARPWPEWVASVVRRDAPLARIDLPTLADDWARHVGPKRVHVVLDDPDRAARLAARRRRPLPANPGLSADAVELARRTGPVLGTLVTPDRRRLLMWHRLRPVLAAEAGPALTVPERHHDRLRAATADMRARLTHGDYAVHGELADPVPRAGVTAPDEERVLALALRLLLGPLSAGAVATTGPLSDPREAR